MGGGLELQTSSTAAVRVPAAGVLLSRSCGRAGESRFPFPSGFSFGKPSCPGRKFLRAQLAACRARRLRTGAAVLGLCSCSCTLRTSRRPHWELISQTWRSSTDRRHSRPDRFPASSASQKQSQLSFSFRKLLPRWLVFRQLCRRTSTLEVTRSFPPLHLSKCSQAASSGSTHGSPA